MGRYGVAALAAISIPMLGLPGCTSQGPETAAPGGQPAAGAGAAPASTVASGTAPSQLCAGLTARRAGTVADSSLTELSGLAASRHHPGVLWAHNDSGHAAVLFALGLDGANRGEFPLVGIAETDTEDIALVDGTVYLADIGDNDQRRAENGCPVLHCSKRCRINEIACVSCHEKFAQAQAAKDQFRRYAAVGATDD